ncbi:MAG: tetratricopeptide repeat protein [Myxococcales bacterium]
MNVALLAALLVPSATPAAKVQQAEFLARRSITEYNAGKFEASLEDATNAYLADPKAGLLYNIGQCHRALHDWERAEFFYRRYLAEKPGAPNRAGVEKLIAEMQAKQKEEAAAKAAPPPVAPVIVATAPPVPAAQAAPAPAAAVTAPAEPPHKKHGLAIGLGVTGVVMLGLMTASIVGVVNYNGEYGSGAAKGTQFDPGAYRTAGVLEIAEFVTGALGIAGVTSAVLTW